jgi:hypothetical protein
MPAHSLSVLSVDWTYHAPLRLFENQSIRLSRDHLSLPPFPIFLPRLSLDKIKEMSPCNGQHSSGVFGHQLLLEYLEEHPPLLGHLGMGVKLTTFYKKRTETDSAGSQQLLIAAQAATAAESRGEIAPHDTMSCRGCA